MAVYLHASSHVKPRRVKMCMQMRAGGKEHKNNKRRHSGSFCFCVGQELVRGEAVVSLKRGKRRELSNMKRSCWLVIAGFCKLRDAVATLLGSVTFGDYQANSASDSLVWVVLYTSMWLQEK